MPDELLFHVSGSTAGERISLADAGLREREHLQEWVLANPQILGDDVMIITFEFDRWLPAVKSHAKVRDRHDILGVDTAGTIVVAELKRDVAPDTVEMQAIKYASMAAQFTRPRWLRRSSGTSRRQARRSRPTRLRLVSRSTPRVRLTSRSFAARALSSSPATIRTRR
jgi:hypothetical protein